MADCLSVDRGSTPRSIATAGVSEPALSKLTHMGASSETAWKWYHQEKQIRLLMSPPHGAVALIGRAPDLHSGG